MTYVHHPQHHTGMSTMTDVEKDPALETEILSRAHRVLDDLGDETVFSSYEEFRLHASAFLVATLQLRLKRKFPDVNRAPVSFEDHRFNAQVFLDAVRRYLNIELKNVTPELICSGDYHAIMKSIDVIECLSAAKSIASDDKKVCFEETATNDKNALLFWNNCLSVLNLPVLTNWNELQDNASSIITLIAEAIIQRRLKGLVRRPLLKRDYLVNARISLKALCKFVSSKLDPVQLAEELVAGNALALSRIAELVSMALRRQNAQEFKCGGNSVKPTADKGKSKIRSSSENESLPLNNRSLLSEREHIVLKQLNAMNIKSLADEEVMTQRILKSSSKREQCDRIQREKAQAELARNEAVLRKIRDETFRYQIGKVFRHALKLERNYHRAQFASFKDQRKQLDQQWSNKKISMERFFSDKYEMLMNEIHTASTRRKGYEVEALVALRKMEKELRLDREKRLQTLKDQLLQQDQKAYYFEPDRILNWLLKVPAN